jgi:hypothetical protein
VWINRSENKVTSYKVLCHHGIEHPQVAEGDGHQILRVAVNILYEQLWTAYNEWTCLGVEFKTHKKAVCYEMLHRASNFGGFFGTT